MADEAQTTGTPIQDGGDAAEQSQMTGTPGEDGRNAETKPGISPEEALAWKAKAEDYNRLQAQYNEVAARLAQTPAAPSTDRPDTESGWNDVQTLAASGDAAAKAALLLREQREQDRKIVADLYQLQALRLPAQDEQAVIEHYDKNRHRFGDPKTAWNDLRSQRQDVELTKLRDELKRQAIKNDPEVVRTDTREVRASEQRVKEMTRAQFDEAQERLRSEGRYSEAMALQGDLARGKVNLTR